MIKPTTDCRYNLVFTYGEFLQSVPQRLGSNKALDGAAQALVVSHRDFSRRQPVSAESLARYSDAIQALTRSLDDPVKSLSLETICAVVLLTMCQVCIIYLLCQGPSSNLQQNLSGLSLQHLTSHCQGAVQMLGARQSHVMADEFELALHTYLHGPVVSSQRTTPYVGNRHRLTWPQLVQALFNRTMRLSTSKFEALTRALKFNMDAPGQGTVILLYKLPALLQRGRAMMQGAADRDAFFAELSSMYQALRKASAFVYTKFMKAPGPGPKRTGPYGFCLAFACIFNCMLRGVEPNNTQLQLEAEELVASTIALVPEAQHGRPLAAGHMMLNLSAGWMCTQKENERQMLQDMLSEFSWDFRRDADTMWPTYDLEALYADLQFRTDPEVVLAHNT